MFAPENLLSRLRPVALLAALLMLGACGFRGPLYLPEDGPPANSAPQPQLGEIPSDDPLRAVGEEDPIEEVQGEEDGIDELEAEDELST